LEHVFLHQSRWRMCWNCHRPLQESCQMASDHQAEYHVQGSTTPSKHYRSAHQLAQHGLRYIHAGRKIFLTSLPCPYSTKLSKYLGYVTMPCDSFWLCTRNVMYSSFGNIKCHGSQTTQMKTQFSLQHPRNWTFFTSFKLSNRSTNMWYFQSCSQRSRPQDDRLSVPYSDNRFNSIKPH
jgi:hypothetical protein